MSTDLDWLIVGGGIHGVHIAARLLGDGEVPLERARIVDPAPRLLDRWRTCAATTGMTHLRSPVVHHVGLRPFALRRFAAGPTTHDPEPFAPPYDRPSLRLFNAHCDQVVRVFELDTIHLRAWASSIAVDCDGVAVQTSDGDALEARNVILALGAGEQPLWPDWAPRDHDRVHHVFQRGFHGWPDYHGGETVAVIGGGISAAQVAIRLAKEGHAVHLVSRHALREHQFDSDPGWLGPRCMTAYLMEENLERRRARINEARHRGSVPPDVVRALKQATEAGTIVRHEASVDELVAGSGGLRLVLSSGQEMDVERVLLATGFSPQRPGGKMIDELVASASLPCARCGYPVVDPALRWHPRVHVTGPLAELELGPASRNIAGARRAGERLVSSLR